jgi:glycerol-1-phosphatase
VTSGTRALVNGWLEVMKLPPPPLLVVAEDVDNGKPDPQCYVMGLERIGLKGRLEANIAKRVLVVEDAPAGVKAGKAAGCMVLGLGTTHSPESLRRAGADWIIKDLASLKLLDTKEGVTRVEIRETWVPQE